MSDEKRKASLEAIAETAYVVAKMHGAEGGDGGCIVGRLASDIAHTARKLAAGHGPAQVATDAYRTSWDVTFGGKRAERGQA